MKLMRDSITPIEHSPEAFKRALIDHLYYTRGQAIYTATPIDIHYALACTVRDYLMVHWQKNVDAYWEQNPKFVYYLSAEYLMGRQLPQNLLYTQTESLAREVLAEYDIDLDDLIAIDAEPGLGNGGLGRLAACFMDSLATLDIPAVGYGIRYEFGIFRQRFEDGWQVESPDNWLHYGNPWEFAQPDDMVEVRFGGYTEGYVDDEGNYRVRWVASDTVFGEPYHTLVPGYGTETTNMLRLWRARATSEFNFQLFDVGDYARAVEQKTHSENISKVLYPNDNTPQGAELRLKQQYFFVACSLHNIMQRFQIKNTDWKTFPDIAVIQLNDTHPVIAIPEFMRLLLDKHGLSWDVAWSITNQTFASTQHTLLPEALEKWPTTLMRRLLPRHLEIIFEINHRFLDEVRSRFPGDEARVRRMSIIDEDGEQSVRMAYLATVASFSVNGVAQLQSDLLQERVLRDFYELWPEKFNNKTNGVTPRRFMRLANPAMSELITSTIGEGWLKDLDQLHQLEAYAEEEAFQEKWRAIKQNNKTRLATYAAQKLGLAVNPNSMFDVMVKRLHEYKRQLLKVLHIITLYHRIKAEPSIDIVPRTFVFGAKSAPGYHMAKLIIKLINSVGDVVNDDADVAGRLKVVFVPNFNVTLGELIYPAADLSEQISLAGKEASGTGNMKFALNGALTVGTLDGANIEIRDRVGAENFFLFGKTAPEVFELKATGFNPWNYYEDNAELRAAIDAISVGRFSHGDTGMFRDIVNSLLYQDDYLLLVDYPSYVAVQDTVDKAYRDQKAWTQMSILNTARCGFFSSDRTMRQYSAEIWKTHALEIGDNNAG
jgi:starch phosphorylase